MSDDIAMQPCAPHQPTLDLRAHFAQKRGGRIGRRCGCSGEDATQRLIVTAVLQGVAVHLATVVFARVRRELSTASMVRRVRTARTAARNLRISSSTYSSLRNAGQPA